MEEKSLENNSAAVQDKYRESFGEETAVPREEKMPEREISSVGENNLESPDKPVEKPAIEKKEEMAEKKDEREPTEEKPSAEVSQTVGGEAIEEAKSTAAQPSAKARKKAKELKGLDQPGQIKALSDLAFQKGLDYAIEVAKALDNAYLLDELHDSLVDELYQKLVEEGKLKKL